MPGTDPTKSNQSRTPTLTRPSFGLFFSFKVQPSLRAQQTDESTESSLTLSTSCPASAKTLTTLPGIGEATRPVDSAAEDEAPRAARPLGLMTVSSYLHACVRVFFRVV